MKFTASGSPAHVVCECFIKSKLEKHITIGVGVTKRPNFKLETKNIYVLLEPSCNKLVRKRGLPRETDPTFQETIIQNVSRKAS